MENQSAIFLLECEAQNGHALPGTERDPLGCARWRRKFCNKYGVPLSHQSNKSKITIVTMPADFEGYFEQERESIESTDLPGGSSHILSLVVTLWTSSGRLVPGGLKDACSSLITDRNG